MFSEEPDRQGPAQAEPHWSTMASKATALALLDAKCCLPHPYPVTGVQPQSMASTPCHVPK